MATNTTNYNLTKPADNETADIQVINGNMDKVDAALLPENSLESESTKKALAAAQGKVLDGKISALNASLSAEITNRQNEDAKKLPLTGGVLSGDVSINKASPALLVTDTITPSTGHIKQTTGNTYISNIKPSGTDYSSLIVRSIDSTLNDAIQLYRSNYGTTNIYGTHNITVSTSAPTGTLAEGAQHQVYA